MAARNNLNNQVAGETQCSTNRVVALFSKREDGYHALSKLKEAGFDNDQIGLGVGYEQKQTQEYDSSFWQKIKDFFTGEDHHEETDFQDVSAPMGWTDERYRYYERGISSGGAVVTVTGERLNEARTILQQYGGDLRESGFETSASRFAGTTGNRGRIGVKLATRLLTPPVAAPATASLSKGACYPVAPSNDSEAKTHEMAFSPVSAVRPHPKPAVSYTTRPPQAIEYSNMEAKLTQRAKKLDLPTKGLQQNGSRFELIVEPTTSL